MDVLVVDPAGLDSHLLHGVVCAEHEAVVVTGATTGEFILLGMLPELVLCARACDLGPMARAARRLFTAAPPVILAVTAVDALDVCAEILG